MPASRLAKNLKSCSPNYYSTAIVENALTKGHVKLSIRTVAAGAFGEKTLAISTVKGRTSTGSLEEATVIVENALTKGRVKLSIRALAADAFGEKTLAISTV